MVVQVCLQFVLTQIFKVLITSFLPVYLTVNAKLLFLMYFCILILPFLSFISCVCFGRFIGIRGSCFLSTSAIFTSFFLSVFALYETAVLSSNCTLCLAP